MEPDWSALMERSAPEAKDFLTARAKEDSAEPHANPTRVATAVSPLLIGFRFYRQARYFTFL